MICDICENKISLLLGIHPDSIPIPTKEEMKENEYSFVHYDCCCNKPDYRLYIIKHERKEDNTNDKEREDSAEDQRERDNKSIIVE